MITFYVPGKPAPRGSKRHVGRGILIESSREVGPWRERECDEDGDKCALEVYSDGSPVFSLVRDFSAAHPTPPEYLTGDIWDLPPGTEVVIEDPPYKRTHIQ